MQFHRCATIGTTAWSIMSSCSDFTSLLNLPTDSVSTTTILTVRPSPNAVTMQPFQLTCSVSASSSLSGVPLGSCTVTVTSGGVSSSQSKALVNGVAELTFTALQDVIAVGSFLPNSASNFLASSSSSLSYSILKSKLRWKIVLSGASYGSSCATAVVIRRYNDGQYYRLRRIGCENLQHPSSVLD